MRVRLLRERAVNELRANVSKNLDVYRTGDFGNLLIDPNLSFESDIDLREADIENLRDPVGAQNFESENCACLLGAMPTLTPYQAADERVWTMLSHTVLMKHARARWPIPKGEEEAAKHIRTHFFAQTQRQLERDNVGSRLWWMGHLCSRVKGLPLHETLDVLLYRSDVRANIVERPTTAQSIPVFSALMTKLAKSHKGKQKLFERRTFRLLMVYLNGLGGYRLLDALDVNFQEVVHSDLAGNADVTKPQ
jgi:hypothetical protein